MAKDTALKVAELMEEINKKHGAGSIYTLDKQGSSMRKVKRFKTGMPQVDEIIGGGWPRGRIGEIYGPEGGGKSTFAMKLAAGRKQSVYFDMEGTFDPHIARVNGVKDGSLILRQPDWGEQALEEGFKFAEAGIPLIIYDSVPTLTPHIEFEGKKGMEGTEGMAMIARLLSRKLPVLATKCKHSGTTVLFINQVRDKIGGMMFGEGFSTPGGRMLKHAASLRIQIGRRMWLKSSDEVLGQLCKVRVIKSKVCSPYMDAEVPLIFDRGFVPFDEHKAILKEVRKAHVKARRAAGKGDNEGALMIDDLIQAQEEGENASAQ